MSHYVPVMVTIHCLVKTTKLYFSCCFPLNLTSRWGAALRQRRHQLGGPLGGRGHHKCNINVLSFRHLPHSLQSDFPVESSIAADVGTNLEGRSEAAFSRSSAQSGGASAADRDDASATDMWSTQVNMTEHDWL